jgi:hypothetical protein
MKMILKYTRVVLRLLRNITLVLIMVWLFFLARATAYGCHRTIPLLAEQSDALISSFFSDDIPKNDADAWIAALQSGLANRIAGAARPHVYSLDLDYRCANNTCDLVSLSLDLRAIRDGVCITPFAYDPDTFCFETFNSYAFNFDKGVFNVGSTPVLYEPLASPEWSEINAKPNQALKLTKETLVSRYGRLPDQIYISYSRSGLSVQFKPNPEGVLIPIIYIDRETGALLDIFVP